MMRNYAVKGTTGEWQEFNGDELEQAIRELAGNPDLDAIHQFANRSQRAFEDDKSEVLSLLTTAIDLQKMNWKCRTGIHEQTGVSLQRDFGPT
jgi:hypothetical protein